MTTDSHRLDLERIRVYLCSSVVPLRSGFRMKPKLVINCATAVLCLLQIASALPKSDFSGTWLLDVNRSFSNPPGLEQTLMVAQTGDQIKVETRLKTQQGEQTINEAYTLDGKEVDFTPPSTQPGAKGKRKAAWLSDGRRIVIDYVVSSDSANCPATPHTT